MKEYYLNKDINDLPNETWKCYKDKYYVSNLGRVKFIGGKLRWGNSYINKKPYILNQTEYNTGYLKCGQGKVHRMIAEAFIPNPNNKPSVNHIDGNKKNNKVNNLEWATYSEQQIHARKIGLYGPPTEAQKIAWHNNGVKNVKYMCHNISEQNKGRKWMTNDKVNKFANKKQQIELLNKNFRYGYNSSLRGGGV